jgi:L-fucose isomerase-like protein
MDRCTYDIVASPLHDLAELGTAVESLVATVEQLGGVRREPDPALPHLVLVASGGTETAILDRLDERERSCHRSPALLIAHPKHNSLPAALEALARLHQLGRRGRIVFADGSDDDGLREGIDDLTAWHRLHDTRLGLVGAPSDWLVASTPTAEIVRRRWGPELVDVSIPETIRAFAGVPVEVGRSVATRFGGTRAAGLPAPDDVVRAARLDPALREMIDRQRLDAITVRCFDFLGALDTSGCVALAQLNDDGIVAGCEGDVPSALAMLWVRHLLDRPAWIANPASVHPATNEVVLAHCTIAPSMIDGVELSTHFESGIGVGVHGRLRHGDVTLIRLGGAELDRIWIAGGRVTRSGEEPDLCRTQATVEVSDRPVSELLDDPLGNHVVLVEGTHRARLERWWNWAVGPLR